MTTQVHEADKVELAWRRSAMRALMDWCVTIENRAQAEDAGAFEQGLAEIVTRNVRKILNGSGG